MTKPVSPGPLYRQVTDDLRGKIESGEIGQGERLPTEDQLMKSYSASRNTVRAAIKELTTGGLVHTLHGRGTFVSRRVQPLVTTLTADPATSHGGGETGVYIAEVRSSGREPRMSHVRIEVHRARPAIADGLRIPEGADVVSRHEQRFVDDEPWSLQTSWYPMDLARRAPRLLSAENIPEGTVAYIRELGIRQVGYRDSIQVRSPNQDEISFFGLPVDGRIPVVEIYRVGFSQEDDPGRFYRFRLTITIYRADRNRFVIDVGLVPPRSGLAPALADE